MESARMALAIRLAGTTTAFAQDALDANGDGLVSLAEIKALHPEFVDADFTQVDIDGNGMLNDDEVALAVGSGILPAPE